MLVKKKKADKQQNKTLDIVKDRQWFMRYTNRMSEAKTKSHNLKNRTDQKP